VEDLIHAIEIDPENADYHVELGSVYRLGLSDYDAALREYQSGYEVSGEPWRLEDLMSLQMFLGDLDGALATTDLRISREPDYLPAHLDRAYVLLQLGELDEAEAITTPGLESDDEYSRARAVYLMGLIATERGEWERAVAMLNDAAGYEPWTYDWPFLNRGEDHAVDVDLARAHLGAGNVDAALEHLDRAEAHDEGWFLPYYWRGVVMTEVGNLDAARTNFAIALDNLSEESAERWHARHTGVLWIRKARPRVALCVWGGGGGFLSNAQFGKVANCLRQVCLCSNMDYTNGISRVDG
jgi:tetratricopeptide (TPR) repeat protein